MPTQDDINIEFIASKGFDTETNAGLKKAMQWLRTASADELMYGEPTGDPFDIAVGEFRRPMLIESCEKEIEALKKN